MKRIVLMWALALSCVVQVQQEASAALPYGDINGDGNVNVVDVQLMIGLSLGLPMSPTLDADGDGVADLYAANAVLDCGANTVAENGICVVDPDWLAGIESQVLRPIKITLSWVMRRKYLRSSGICQGSVPSFPIQLFFAIAAIMDMDIRTGLLISHNS